MTTTASTTTTAASAAYITSAEYGDDACSFFGDDGDNADINDYCHVLPRTSYVAARA